MDSLYSPRDRLQDLLEYIQKFKHQDKFLSVGCKPSPNMSPFENIQYTSQAFLAGGLPNAETLEYIAISFDKYIRKKGEISLDEAFGLKSKSGVGNASALYDKENEVNGLLFKMAYQIAQSKLNRKRLSRLSAANIVLSDEKYSPSTLEDYYKERKCQRIANMLTEAGHLDKQGRLIF